MLRLKIFSKVRSKLWWQMAVNSTIAFFAIFSVSAILFYTSLSHIDHKDALQYHYIEDWVETKALPEITKALVTKGTLSKEDIQKAASVFDTYAIRLSWGSDPIGFLFHKKTTGPVYVRLTIKPTQGDIIKADWPYYNNALDDASKADIRLIELPIFSSTGEKIADVTYFICAPFNIFDALKSAVLFPKHMGQLIFSSILAGIISALLTASGYSSRLGQIVKVTNGWSKGDFTKRIDEEGSDEITDHMQRLNHMAEELQEIVQLRQQITAKNERHFFASELHDTVKQNVFALSMQLGAIKTRDDISSGAKEQLDEASRTVEEINREIITLLNNLNNKDNSSTDLEAVLHDIAEKYHADKDLNISLQTVKLAVSENSAHHLKRIVQECLTNIWKHASSTEVKISLLLQGKNWELSVCDNGSGFNPSRRNTDKFGLQNIIERGRKIDACVTINSDTENGTCIKISWQASANIGQNNG